MYFFSGGRGPARTSQHKLFIEDMKTSVWHGGGSSTLPASVYSPMSVVPSHMIVQHFWTRAWEARLGLHMLRLVHCSLTCSTTLNAAWMVSTALQFLYVLTLSVMQYCHVQCHRHPVRDNWTVHRPKKGWLDRGYHHIILLGCDSQANS